MDITAVVVLSETPPVTAAVAVDETTLQATVNPSPGEAGGGGGGGEDGSGASLSNATPQPLGTAAAGTAATASRGDHRHAMPTAAQVGADASGTAAAAISAHENAADPHPGYLTPAEGDGRYRLSSTALSDGDIPAGIARDAEVTGAISAHENAADPHPGYLTPAEGNAAYATAAQGARADAADYLVPLAGSEIAIAATATATISRQHLVSGTTADYTVTLPAAAGNAGKFISFRISDAATRRFTIRGDASELINGQNARIMWAGESAVLYCDGSGWRKLSGVTKPMQCQIASTSVQSILNLTLTDVTFSRVDVDNTGEMADIANSRIRNFRPGQYILMAHLMWFITNGSATRLVGQIFDSNTSVAITAHEMSAFAAGSYPSCQSYALVTLLATSTIKLQAFKSANVTNVYGHPTSDTTQLLAIEVPSW